MQNQQLVTFAMCLQRTPLHCELKRSIIDIASTLSFPFKDFNKKRETRRKKLKCSSTTVLFDDELRDSKYIFDQATTLMEYTSSKLLGGTNPYHYGACISGGGLFVDVIYPGKKKTRLVPVVDMSSDGLMLARSDVEKYLSVRGITTYFSYGRLD